MGANEKVDATTHGAQVDNAAALIAEAQERAERTAHSGWITAEETLVWRLATALEAVTAERDNLARLHEVATETNAAVRIALDRAGERFANREHGAIVLSGFYADVDAALASAPGDVLREWLASKFEPADYYEAKPHKAADDLIRVLRANEGGN